MKKLFFTILFTLILNSNAYSASFECVEKWRDKNGILQKDLFAWSYVEINTWLRKMTFFPFKSGQKRNEGIKFDTLNFSKKRSYYGSEKFKQRKLTEQERKFFKDRREYIWEEVKDDFLIISFRNLDYNPFELQVYPVDLQKKWIRTYDCYIPRKKK